MAHKIQDELDQVERQVYILEKEENELRRVLWLLIVIYVSFSFFIANIVISKCKCKIKGSEVNFRERIQSESVLNVLRYWNGVFHFLLSAACQHPSPLLIVSRQNLSCVVVPVSTPRRGKIDLFRLYICFPNTDHVIILRSFDPLSCPLKRVHSSMNMSACTLFNEQDKGSNLLSMITWSVLGKQNVQAKKVYWLYGLYHDWIE